MHIYTTKHTLHASKHSAHACQKVRTSASQNNKSQIVTVGLASTLTSGGIELDKNWLIYFHPQVKFLGYCLPFIGQTVLFISQS